MFISVILFASFALSPVQLQATSILAIVPSTDKEYSVIFQVCAEDTIMRAPEVKLSSDLEEKNIRISQEIKPNTCRQTSAFIKATDSETINIEKVDKKKLNILINEVDEKMQTIRSEISDKSAEILKLVTEISENKSPNPEINKKINDLNLEISKLRQDLNENKNERDRLRDLLFG